MKDNIFFIRFPRAIQHAKINLGTLCSFEKEDTSRIHIIFLPYASICLSLRIIAEHSFQAIFLPSLTIFSDVQNEIFQDLVWHVFDTQLKHIKNLSWFMIDERDFFTLYFLKIYFLIGFLFSCWKILQRQKFCICAKKCTSISQSWMGRRIPQVFLSYRTLT